jgi:hypothetical protein
MLLDYYDKTYRFSKEKYKKPAVGRITSHTADPSQNARRLIDKANELNL